MAAAAEQVQQQTKTQGRSATPDASRSIIIRIAEKFGVDERNLLNTLKRTAFRQRNDGEITNEQMMALLVVADQYNLNPFTKEIYAFPDKENGIVPVVGVDGWARIINEHKQLDGLEFTYPPQEEWVTMDEDAKPAPPWMSVTIYRKDRTHPLTITEYLDEVYKAAYVKNKGTRSEWKKPGPWQTHTKRQLRHKTLIQGARVAFAFVGIFDEDEADRIIEGEAQRIREPAAERKPAPVTEDAQGAPTVRSIEDKSGKASNLMDQLFAAQADPERAPEKEPEPVAQGTLLDEYEQEAARA